MSLNGSSGPKDLKSGSGASASVPSVPATYKASGDLTSLSSTTTPLSLNDPQCDFALLPSTPTPAIQPTTTFASLGGLDQRLKDLQVSPNMSKHPRDQVELEPDPARALDSPSRPSTSSLQDQEERKRQKLIDQISTRTAVDPADQLRSDQLALLPRSYQLELAQLAQSGNVLVCLDTGSGKTLISVLLLQHLHQQVVSLPLPASAEHSLKVSFFLVNLVPLVHQQSSVIAGNSDLRVGKLYGELKDTFRAKGKLSTDNWREPQWSALLQSHQVIVSTAQCFLDALIHGFVKMKDINLLIFDEVHHALKNHPFLRIMKYYRLAREDERPKIFGMTASPIFTGTGEFEEASRYLQTTMDARIHTVSKNTLEELKRLRRKPEELVMEFEPFVSSLDEGKEGVQMSELSQRMLLSFGKHPDLEDALDQATECFENEVRPKLEYTMRQMGPIGCDLLWHSTLLEFRSRASKWVGSDRTKRTLVNDDWILDASMHPRSDSQTPSTDSCDENMRATDQAQSTDASLGLGFAVGHLSTDAVLNQRILRYMRSQPLLPDALNLDASNASPKTLRLIQILGCFAPSAYSFCGIIFVERRQTATILVELIKRSPSLSFIHPEFLLGHENGSANGGAPGMDWHDQVQVLNRFRRRNPTNLLIATSIAEEGLDIQAANLVIRFDLFNRHISYLQSRGRARAVGSRFILMAETGNQKHAEIILNAFRTEANRATWLGQIAYEHDAGFEDEEWQQKLRIEAIDAQGEDYIYEPGTGARLFAEDAPTLVSHYVATLHSEYLKDAVLAYELETFHPGFGIPNAYKCVLKLPSNSAVRSVVSGECRTKKQAKRGAAFKACQQLREAGELDEWLMPRLVDGVQREIAVGKKINPHHQAWRGSGLPVQVPAKKMDGWARFCAKVASSGSDREDVYHATYLPLDEWSEICQPVMLLARGKLPSTKRLRLMTSDGQFKDVCPKDMGWLPPLSKEDVESAKRFTRLVYGLIDRKDEIGPNGKGKGKTGSYEPAVLIVPVRKKNGVAEVQSVDDIQIDLPDSLDLSQLDVSKATQLEGRVLVRQHGYHSLSLYQFEAVRPDLSPNSAIGTPATASNSIQAPTYLSQHLKMYGRFHASRNVASEDILDVLACELADTPLLAVKKLPKSANLLCIKSALSKPTFIVPYFYAVHPVPSALLHSILLLPSIMTRYDQVLLAHSLNATLFGSRLETDRVLEALTSPGACEFDYERLEFLGDTFLKLVATCHTFTTYLGLTEADLHMANKAILTNVRLLAEAKRVGLDRWGVFESSQFAGKKFSAPVVGRIGGELVHSTRQEVDEAVKEGERDSIKEKTLSDMVESLIGCALLSSSSHALSVCHTFNLLPIEIVELSSFNDLLATLKSRSIDEGWQDRISPQGLHHLESLFSHTYKYPHLGLEAFTHPSLLGGLLPSYQRLEFLGDAWLDFYIVRKIYRSHAELAPGELTALKGILASNAALSALGVQLGLHRFIASDSTVLQTTIQTYVEELEKLEKKGQYWLGLPHGVVVPKAIADVVEASLASIVVDSGFDEHVGEEVFKRIFEPFYDKYCPWDGLKVSGVKRVLEYVFGSIRRAITTRSSSSEGSGAGRRMLEVRTNLCDPEMALSSEMEEQDKGETLVQALLSELWVELWIDSSIVAKISTLPRSALHLEKASLLMGTILEIQSSFAPSRDTPSTADSDREDIESSHRNTLLQNIDRQQHVLKQLLKILDWKTTFQPLAADTDSIEEKTMSLTQLRALFEKPPQS